MYGLIFSTRSRITSLICTQQTLYRESNLHDSSNFQIDLESR